jgi:hypothetical protein
MPCKCGYKGDEIKMDFNVDEAYNYLVEHGFVYTVRPSFGWTKGPYKRLVHLHRKHKWTGEMAMKEGVDFGVGADNLQLSMGAWIADKNLHRIDASGFKTVDDWYAKLVAWHGKEITSFRWAIFEVTLVKEQTKL